MTFAVTNRTCLLAVLGLLAAWMAGSAAAQSSVAGFAGDLVSCKQPLTAEQHKAVADATAALADRFAAADPAGIVTIRTETANLLRSVNVGTGFRRDFSIEFAKSFRRFTSAKDAARATNVFIIARFAGTAESVDFIVDSLDPGANDDEVVRIAAASQLCKAVEAAPLSPPQLEAISKRLAAVLRRETEWVAASHEVECMAQMLRVQSLPAAQADAIAGHLASTINDLAAKVMDDSQPQLVNTLQRSLLAVRNQLSGVAGSARTKLLNTIAPSVEKLAAMKNAPPKSMTSEDLQGTFDAVANTAGLLKGLLKKGKGAPAGP